jgi:hypothetical protein
MASATTAPAPRAGGDEDHLIGRLGEDDVADHLFERVLLAVVVPLRDLVVPFKRRCPSRRLTVEC